MEAQICVKIKARFHDQDWIILVQKGCVKQKPLSHMLAGREESHGQSEAFDLTTQVDLLRTTVMSSGKQT